MKSKVEDERRRRKRKRERGRKRRMKRGRSGRARVLSEGWPRKVVGRAWWAREEGGSEGWLWEP